MPTKLSDLNPRWTAEEGRSGQGILFDCPGPCCAGRPSMYEWEPGMAPWRKRAGVVFANPIDGGAPMPGPGPLWNRTGDTFETLTLTGSVWISPPEHWHGHITDGEAKTC